MRKMEGFSVKHKKIELSEKREFLEAFLREFLEQLKKQGGVI